jgi:hypothetical protein
MSSRTTGHEDRPAAFCALFGRSKRVMKDCGYGPRAGHLYDGLQSAKGTKRKSNMSTQNNIRNKLLARILAEVKRSTPYLNIKKYAA